jgi:hypothetical protein
MFDQHRPITGDEREKLYSEVWEEPASIVCKRYGVSDTTLRNWCLKYGIPLPYSGYWARVRAGQKVIRTELPDVTGEVKRYIRNYNLKFRMDINDLNYETLTQISCLDMLREETQFKITEKCSKFKVKDQLKNPHMLIKEYQEELKYREKRNNALSKIDKKSKRYETIKSQYRDDKKVLPIEVSNQNLNRSFCLLDAIFKVIEEFEGYISTGYNYSSDFAIYLMNSMIMFSITETKDKLLLTLHPESYFEKSKLDIMIFQDTEELLLENQLGDIIKKIFIVANKLLAMDKLTELEKQRQEKNERRKKLLEKARKGELEELKELYQLATDWENANKIRKFMIAVENKAEDIVDITEKDQISEWIQRNRKRADWIDPLIRSNDELLGSSISIFDEILGM